MKPKWMIEAEKCLGTSEIVGSKHNANIVGWLRKVAKWVSDDETPWCAAFVAHCLYVANLPNTGSLAARSYEKYGIGLRYPVLGCIVTMHRGDPKNWQGHVGFCVGMDHSERLLILGGNQGNKVSKAWFNRSRVTDYRWPTGVPVPEEPVPFINSKGEPESVSVA